MLLALSPAILCAYTTLTVQDFHEKLQNGFFAVVVDVYAACLPQAQPTSCKLHRSYHAGDGSPSGRTDTSLTRPTSRDCKSSQATWSRRSCWAARRATSCSTARPATAPSGPPTSSPRSASRVASTTALASKIGRRACAHMLETRPVPSSHRGCPHHGRAPATRPCAHRRETTPPARKPQGSAVGSGRRSRASHPTCPTARRR